MLRRRLGLFLCINGHVVRHAVVLGLFLCINGQPLMTVGRAGDLYRYRVYGTSTFLHRPLLALCNLYANLF